MADLTPSFTPAEIQEMVELRRDLHAHPEIAFEETRTAGVVADRLRALGLEPRTGVGRTGVTATVRGGRPGRTVLLRADMDALLVREENDLPWRSQHDGRMHACGHDCHVAGLLGVARQLARQAPSLPGAVTFCFQPAEERGGGALAMIADGVLTDPRVDAAFGVHVWQDLPVGKIGVTTGPWMASVDEFCVTLRGKGAHAAAPHQGVDPVVAMAHVIAALQTIASRGTDPLLEVVVSVTQVRAGAAFNVIPEEAWMNGTVRAFDVALWKELPGRFERIVRGVAGALGCAVELTYERHNMPTVNEPAMAELAREVAVGIVGRGNVVTNIRTMGGEDFSAFLHEVPGAFLTVGSRNEVRGLVHMHHHPRFDVDEACIPIGAELLLRIARRFLEA